MQDIFLYFLKCMAFCNSHLKDNKPPQKQIRFALFKIRKCKATIVTILQKIFVISMNTNSVFIF